MKCPVCDSGDVTRSLRTEALKLPYAKPVEFQAVYATCNVCDCDGDFYDENDKVIEAALTIAYVLSTNAILDILIQRWGRPNLLRVLGMPQVGSIERWRAVGCTPAEHVLLRALVVHPELLAEADDGFDGETE